MLLLDPEGRGRGIPLCMRLVDLQYTNYFLNCGCVHVEMEQNGVSALMLACDGGHLVIVKLLLERGAVVDHQCHVSMCKSHRQWM